MVEILGFDIISCAREEYVKTVFERVNAKQKTVIISGNPEILNTALKNPEVESLFRVSDIIPDGIGVLLAGKLTRQRFMEKLAGIEVMEEILKQSAAAGIKIYMLGAEKWVVEKAAEVCAQKYSSIIAGFHDGYFDMDNCPGIIEDINRSGADIIFAAMGCPRQELFISRFRDILNCSVFMGVGGSFDVLSGKAKRAPVWMRKIGLEWLYRVSKEPIRILRLTSIPVFLFKAVFLRRRYSV